MPSREDSTPGETIPAWGPGLNGCEIESGLPPVCSPGAKCADGVSGGFALPESLACAAGFWKRLRFGHSGRCLLLLGVVAVLEGFQDCGGEFVAGLELHDLLQFRGGLVGVTED